MEDYLTIEQIENTERYGHNNEVNYALIFEDLKKGRIIMPKEDGRHKGHQSLKYPLCVCGHPKSQHIGYNNPNLQHRCKWFNCSCYNYTPKEEEK